MYMELVRHTGTDSPSIAKPSFTLHQALVTPEAGVEKSQALKSQTWIQVPALP